jgi:hypothetical protein
MIMKSDLLTEVLPKDVFELLSTQSYLITSYDVQFKNTG